MPWKAAGNYGKAYDATETGNKNLYEGLSENNIPLVQQMYEGTKIVAIG